MVFNWLEWSGAATGLLGAFLLAHNGKYANRGWIFFLVANGFVIAFALQQNHPGLLVQQVGFTASSLYGIARSKKRQPETGLIDQSLESYYAAIPCEHNCPSSSVDTCRKCEQAAGQSGGNY